MLLLLALIWGSSFMFIKIADRELDPATLVLGRIFARRRRRSRSSSPRRSGARRTLARCGRHGPALVLVGLVNTAVPFWLLSWGETRIDSGTRVDHPGLCPDLQRPARVRLLPRAARRRAQGGRRRGRLRRGRPARRRAAGGEDPRRARGRRHGRLLRSGRAAEPSLPRDGAAARGRPRDLGRRRGGDASGRPGAAPRRAPRLGDDRVGRRSRRRRDRLRVPALLYADRRRRGDVRVIRDVPDARRSHSLTARSSSTRESGRRAGRDGADPRRRRARHRDASRPRAAAPTGRGETSFARVPSEPS